MTLEKAIKTLLVKEPFYGLMLLGLDRSFSNKISTACVCVEGINYKLLINEEFWNKHDDEFQVQLLMHELGHLLYNHLFLSKSFANKDRYNIASDCEINCDLPKLQEEGVCPAKYGLEDHMGSKYYYENLPLPEDGSGHGKPQDGSSGDGDNNDPKTIDDHSTWKEIEGMSDAEKKLVQNQFDALAKNVAEQIMKQAGKIPGQFSDYINGLFEIKKEVFNWKSYFSKIVGNLITSELRLTRMRPSRRFEDSRGVKFVKKPSILIGVDTSGSVDDQNILDFFSEIHHVWKSGVKVTVAEVDTKIQHISEYKGNFDRHIHGRGGTMFKDLYKYYLDNKKDYSAMIVFTDGYVDIADLKGQNVVWVITPDGYHQDYPGLTVYMPKE